jgi:hypothetical protein
MKKLLFLALLLAAISTADNFRFEWGGGCSGFSGYQYFDSLYVTDYFSGTTDTIFELYADTTTAICTTLTITGSGTHTIVVHSKPSGYDWSVDRIDYMTAVSATFVGTGTYTVTIYAIDTAGTDSAVSGVEIEVWDMVGGLKGRLPTLSTGATAFKKDAGSYIIQSATANSYFWQTDTIVVAGNRTDTLFGYNMFELYVIAAPADTNLCQLYGYLYDNQQRPVKYAQITIKPPQVNKNVCAGTFVMMPKVITTTTDINGYWTADVLKCSCMPDTTLEYKISFQAGTIKVGDLSINVPADSSTYKVVGEF